MHAVRKYIRQLKWKIKIHVILIKVHTTPILCTFNVYTSSTKIFYLFLFHMHIFIQVSMKRFCARLVLPDTPDEDTPSASDVVQAKQDDVKISREQLLCF